MSVVLIDFIRGPMLWIAGAVFVCGLAYQGHRFFRLTRDKQPRFLGAAPAGEKKRRLARALDGL